MTEKAMIVPAKFDMKQIYLREKENSNNLSIWFKKACIDVDSCLKIPDTKIFDVPYEVYMAYNMDDPQKDEATIRDWLDQIVIPELGRRQYFLKNGTFSNKFDFAGCITDSRKILRDVISINYAALCLEAGGTTELVLRQIIPHDPQTTPHIYGGLPLRTEIRVFYDFDQHEVLYSANYWDYNYVRPALNQSGSRTDRIIFDALKEEIEKGYEENRQRAEAAVSGHMKQVKLAGRYSVDILVDEKGALWLIDMAVAHLSAYWKYDFMGNLKKPITPYAVPKRIGDRK